jgi:hypothetical protein
MIARWVAVLAIASVVTSAAQAQAEPPRHLRTFPAYLYLLPAPVIGAISAGETTRP